MGSIGAADGKAIDAIGACRERLNSSRAIAAPAPPCESGLLASPDGSSPPHRSAGALPTQRVVHKHDARAN